MEDDPLRRPIGWWLKHVDGLLDVAFEATLGAQDVSRRQWQILNGLAEGTAAAELLGSLSVFEDAEGVHDALAGLILRGWLRTGPDGDEPSEAGSGQAPSQTRSEAGEDAEGVHDALAGLILRGWLRTGPDGDEPSEAGSGQAPSQTRSEAGTEVGTEGAPVEAGTEAAPVEITAEGAPVEITAEGRAQHERISAEVRAMRSAITDDLSEDDYRAVVVGLAKMAQNLERMIVSARGVAKPNPGRS